MPTTFHLRVWTRFLAPVADVWAQKTDPAAISAEFAPWASVRFADEAALKRALAGQVPAEIAGTIRLFGSPVGVSWPTTLSAIEPGRSFRDSSRNSLYSRWEHEHLFEATPDGCRYIDVVTFVPNGPFQKAAAIATRRLFVHRHTVAARQLPADKQATGVGVLRVMVEAEGEATAS
jgi:ligand-binding SRPBCC domain-containing protein